MWKRRSLDYAKIEILYQKVKKEKDEQKDCDGELYKA